MATHSSILAWRIPWTEEPGRLRSMGLQRLTPQVGDVDNGGGYARALFQLNGPTVASSHTLGRHIWVLTPPCLECPASDDTFMEPSLAL